MLAQEVEGKITSAADASFGHEDILHDDQFPDPQTLLRTAEGSHPVLQRIFTHNVRRARFAMRRTVRQLADAIAGMRRRASTPGLSELLAVFREQRTGSPDKYPATRPYRTRPERCSGANRVNARAWLCRVAGQHREAGR